MNTKSTCIYCGASGYGPSCPFSPHKMHVHMSDPKTCCYCGSSGRGPSCQFNPFGKVHVHGIEYNQMIKDSVNNTIIQTYLIKKLLEPVIETKAYQLNLVNSKGKIIKKPETVEELNALTTMDKYIFDLKEALGSTAIQTINNIRILKLEEDTSFNTDKYEKELSIKSKLKNVVEDLTKVICEANKNNISSDTFERLLIEVIESKP